MKPKFINLIFLLAGLWLCFVGLRMITQFMIDPNAIMGSPLPTGETWATWDYWFDWFPMVPLGFFVLIYGMFRIYKDINTPKSISD